MVDTQGHLLAIRVHAAHLHDSKSGKLFLKQAPEKYPSIEGFSADAGYRKTCQNYCQQQLKRPLHINTKIKDTLAILPIRWIVERTFAWLGNYRRLTKDFELLISHAQDMVRIAMIAINLNRIF